MLEGPHRAPVGEPKSPSHTIEPIYFGALPITLGKLSPCLRPANPWVFAENQKLKLSEVPGCPRIHPRKLVLMLLATADPCFKIPMLSSHASLTASLP